jgi:hypothetical protein
VFLFWGFWVFGLRFPISCDGESWIIKHSTLVTHFFFSSSLNVTSK